MTKAGLDYLKDVEQQLSGKKVQKKAFLKKLAADVAERLEEEPELDSTALANAFGSPEELASEFIGSIDAKEVRKAFGWKKIVLIGVIAAFLVWLIMIVALWIDGHYGVHGKGVESIQDDESNYIIVTEEFY